MVKSGEMSELLGSINLKFSLILELLTSDPTQRVYLDEYIIYVERAQIRVEKYSENINAENALHISDTAGAISRYGAEFDFGKIHSELRPLFEQLAVDTRRLRETITR